MSNLLAFVLSLLSAVFIAGLMVVFRGVGRKNMAEPAPIPASNPKATASNPKGTTGGEVVGGIVVILLLVSFFQYCSNEPKSRDWTGHVYPDANNLTRSHALGTFESLQACRDEATSRLRALGAGSAGDYECGYQCRPAFPELGDESALICERTEH